MLAVAGEVNRDKERTSTRRGVVVERKVGQATRGTFLLS